MAARRGKKQARRNGSGGSSGLVWLLAGLVLGGVLVAGVLLRDRLGAGNPAAPRPNPAARAPATHTEPPVAQDAQPEPRKPKYDFYTLLPEKEVVVPDAELSAKAQAERNAPKPAPAPVDEGRYVLQAGAFRATGDAEALKARIALLGLVARVESAQINGETVYRVRMGPYGSASELASAKQTLNGNGLPAVAIRAK